MKSRDSLADNRQVNVFVLTINGVDRTARRGDGRPLFNLCICLVKVDLKFKFCVIFTHFDMCLVRTLSLEVQEDGLNRKTSIKG